MRKKLFFFAALASLCLLLAACIVQHELPPLGEPWGQPTFSGSREASEPGYRSDVGVYIRLANGIIVDVAIDVSGESPLYMVLDNLPRALEERVLATNTFDFSPDAFSSASTVRAARDAGRRALLSIPGVPANAFD